MRTGASMRIVGGRIVVAALLALAIFLATAAGAVAHPGDLDPTFGTEGVANVSFENPLGDGYNAGGGLAPLGFEPNGDVIVAGGVAFSYACEEYGCYAGSSGLVAARLHPDGSPDTDFGDGGTTAIELSTAEQTFGVDDLALDPQGRIVSIVGDYPDGLRVYRLTSEGEPDTSFSGDGRADVFPVSEVGGYPHLAVQSDGSVVIASTRNGGDSLHQSIRLTRVAPDGTVDSSFPSGGQPTDLTLKNDASLDSMAVDSQDRIVVNQRFYDQAANTLPSALYRFASDGSVDSTFGDGGEVRIPSPEEATDAVQGLAIDNTDRVLTVGHTGLLRLNPDGARDTSFGPDGIAPVPGAPDPRGIAMAPDSEGGVFISSGGYDGWAMLRITHLLVDGSPDPNWGIDGVAASYAADRLGGAPAITVDPEGRPLVATGGGLAGAIGRFRIDDDPPADLDADGFTDAEDQCPARTGPQAGCPVYERTLSLRLGKTWRPHFVLLKAVVDSSEPAECVQGLRLDVFRKVPGPDQRIARILLKYTPGARGSALARSISVPRSAKRYYAQLDATFDPRFGHCPELTSDTVRAQATG